MNRFTLAVALVTCSAVTSMAATRHRHHASQEVGSVPHSAALEAMIVRYAKRHGVPEHLVHRVVIRESRYNPSLRNHQYYGLMQISYATARSMGYKGTPAGLLDPDVNLTYAVPYLANAYMLSGGDESRAVALYAGGYYWVAKRKKMISALRTAASPGVVVEPAALAYAPPDPPSNPISRLFHALAAGNAAPAPQPAAQEAQREAAPAGAAPPGLDAKGAPPGAPVASTLAR